MKFLVTLLTLGAALSPCAFAQSASVNTIVGMGYRYPSMAAAPGQLITLFVEGSVQGDISAAVSGIPAPVLQVRPGSGCPAATFCSSVTAVTVQIPYNIEPQCVFTNPACEILIPAQLTITANGVAGPPINLTPVADQVHILTACDTVLPSGSGSAPLNGLPCSPLVTHADGSLVSAASPAQGNESLVAYAVGLGLTAPSIPPGQAATTATPTYETYSLDFNFRPNSLATQPIQPTGALPPILPRPVYSGLAPGFAGLYQINFTLPQIPVGTQACSGAVQSNLTVSVGGLTSFDGAGICVAPPT